MVEYPFRNYLLLYGASAKAEVVNYVRSECIPEEVEQLPNILKEWQIANTKFRRLEGSEIGEAEKIGVADFPADTVEIVRKIEDNLQFRQSFSLLPYEFKLVELGKLVASQRSVNLDYVEILKKKIPGSPTLVDLVEFCLSPQSPAKVPASQALGPAALSFTSENLDFRFLGGFEKKLGEEDLKVNSSGGFPLAALVLLVGFGINTMNALQYAGRYVLNNGFHRAYALMSMGVKEIPLVVQNISNPQLEFPQVVANLPREYLLGSSRPSLLKDFLDSALVKPLRVKARNRIVQIQWGASQFNLPILG